MTILNNSMVSFIRYISLVCSSYGRLLPVLINYWLSKFELILSSNENAGCRVSTHAWVNQGKLA